MATETKFEDLSFDLALLSNGDVKTVTEQDAIKQSLISILNTSPGERVMRPEFGCDLRRFLFDPFDELTADAIADTILNDLGNQEPRITIEQVHINTNYDQMLYEVSIRYSIVNTQQTDSLQLLLIKF